MPGYTERIAWIEEYVRGRLDNWVNRAMFRRQFGDGGRGEADSGKQRKPRGDGAVLQ
jgi:hypothetical protein